MGSDSTSRQEAPQEHGSRARSVVYVLNRGQGRLDDYVFHALAGLRPHVRALSVVAVRPVTGEDASRLKGIADRVVEHDGDAFDHRLYVAELERARRGAPDLEEVIFTGDEWFGPTTDFSQALARADELDADFWDMVQGPDGPRESFPEEGFPDRVRPWLWTVVRASLFESPSWRRFAEEETASRTAPLSERAFRERFEREGFRWAALFSSAEYGSHDPALFAATLLVEDGCPIVDIAALSSYPPLLSRFAALGRETVQAMAERGYPPAMAWQHLARTVPPKALNANGGMLEVLPSTPVGYDPTRPLRLAAIVHVTDLGGVQELLDRLAHLPSGADVFVTTTDGLSAAQLEPLLETWAASHGHSHELRVTPDNPGRDMSDLLVACRDVLDPGRYDLVFKVHSRASADKTVNVLRYFRRYQIENLLDGPGYTKNIIGLFQAEPGLGVVFPPMMHIGYATMGKGWAGLRDNAIDLCRLLGITVPLDRVSPLAPYGGMWVARPEALAALTAYPWSFADYSQRQQKRFGRLSHVQERIVAAAAAQRGFHVRTVLTEEHAAITHTALDYKVDEMFSTTRGYPVEQIRLLHRAGPTGYGGPVALTRMYMRLNHPAAARALRPLYRLAFRAHAALGLIRRAAARLAGERRKKA